MARQTKHQTDVEATEADSPEALQKMQSQLADTFQKEALATPEHNDYFLSLNFFFPVLSN
jgi:hypothetical protein